LAERVENDSLAETGHKGVFRFVAFVVLSWLVGILLLSLFLAVLGALDGEFEGFAFIITSVLFLGAMFTFPIPLVGALAGYPLWLWMVPRLMSGGFSRKIALMLSSGSVVSLTLAILFAFFALRGGDWETATALFQMLLVLLVCGLPAAVLLSQLVYSNTLPHRSFVAAQERSALYAEIGRFEAQSRAKKEGRELQEDRK